MSSIIQRLGYRAYPIPASKRIDDKKLVGEFSHKMAAHLSGLGWIGKSCLLITPEIGPRIRFATLLTNAPLEPTKRVLKKGCGSCTKCVDICPMFLVPSLLGKYSEHKLYLEAERAGAMDCIECGSCAFTCPARIPLIQLIREAKAAILSRKRG